jgi:hypothetical protein
MRKTEFYTKAEPTLLCRRYGRINREEFNAPGANGTVPLISTSSLTTVNF